MNTFLAVVLLVVGVYGSDKSPDMSVVKDTCDTMFCSMGNECVMEGGKPVCACIEKCTGDIGEPVCGIAGAQLITYKSKCHLYKDACERKAVKIALIAEEPCELKKTEEVRESVEIEKNVEKQKPIVCMEKDRDELRHAIIKFVGVKLGMKMDSISYKATLLQYFNSLDLNGDSLVDTAEFMKIIGAEEEPKELEEFLNHRNPILRGLCYTEIVAITDHNSDYKLAFEEFHECLNPEFEAPSVKCELGGSFYEEGQDVASPHDTCNTCKCACGHWICTWKKCNNTSNKVEDQFKQ